MDKKVISPEDYNEEYYLSECDGFRDFLSEGDKLMPKRLRVVWKIAGITPGMNILDAGCGRGELLSECISSDVFSVGIDYSRSALRLAKDFIGKYSNNKEGINLVQSDLKQLPFESNRFNRVIMSDVIEHIEPDYVFDVLLEVRRVLQINGKLIIHTMPNLWYYRFGYPLFRFIDSLRGNRLPKNPRDRYKFSHFHVNEQTPKNLRSILEAVNFKVKVWLYDYRSYSEYPTLMRMGMIFVTRFPLLNNIFCDDIFAVATKVHD